MNHVCLEWRRIQEKRKKGEPIERLPGPVILPSEVDNELDCFHRETFMRINFDAGNNDN